MAKNATTLVKKNPSHRKARTIQWGIARIHLTSHSARLGASRSPSKRTGETDGPAGVDMARTFLSGVAPTLRRSASAGQGGVLRFRGQSPLDPPVEPRLDVGDDVGEEHGVVLARDVAEMRRQDRR